MQRGKFLQCMHYYLSLASTVMRVLHELYASFILNPLCLHSNIAVLLLMLHRCKSCQKFGLHFNKLAAQYADWEKGGQVVKKNSVRMAQIEWGANLQLCKSLGVKKLPSTFIYSEGMKIEALEAGPSRFAKVRDTVKRYASMTPAELQFEAKLEEGKKLMEEAARRQHFEEVARARQLRRSKTAPKSADAEAV